MSDAVLYATDTMADWEYGHLLAELGRAGRDGSSPVRVVVAADTATGPVTTMGGLRLSPDTTLDALDEDAIALLILPGADTWDQGHERVLGLARRLLDRGTPVAAICGATFGLARAGLLDDRAHTSNAPEFLAQSGYRGAAHYRDEPAVDDRGLITASSVYPVDFARAAFERLALRNERWREAWYGLFTTNDPHWFQELMAAAGA